MLRELSKVEQRNDAVLAVIWEWMRVSEVAEKFGVHRDTVLWYYAQPTCESKALARGRYPPTTMYGSCPQWLKRSKREGSR